MKRTAKKQRRNGHESQKTSTIESQNKYRQYPIYKKVKIQKET